VQSGNFVLHVGTCNAGEFKVGDVVTCHVDAHRRLPVMANHTATHLINWALRKELTKTEVEQRGSLVLPEKIRFDFSFDHALSLEQLQHLDAFVNEAIKKDLTVYAKEASLEQARAITGLRAVFGEAYPDPVRVVSIGRAVEDDLKHPEDPTLMDYSIEFCGGTHVPHTSVLQHFVITEQMGLGAGVRRVVAVTGNQAKKVLGNADKIRVQVSAVLEKFKVRFPSPPTIIFSF
jgi:alanyl-tRNA synthetase